MIRFIFCRSLFIVSLFFPTAACQADENWVGTYLYEAKFGQSYSKTPIIVEYKLVLDSMSCRLEIVGYQVDESIRCISEQENNHLAINFQSYSNGKIKNIYDVQIYKKGATLFSIQKEGDELVTTWQAMFPDEKMNKSGRYFTKLNNK